MVKKGIFLMTLNNIGHKISSFSAMDKRGFTLTEVLVVVAIIGVLSSLGVVSLQHAVQNARIKDAAINVSAYMERTANTAARLNTKLCVKTVQNGSAPVQILRTFKGACSTNGTEVIDEMTLESASKFVGAPTNPAGPCNNLTNIYSSGVDFSPKLGLSAMSSGCLYMRYGETEKYAVSIKTSTKNTVFYNLSYDGGSSWSEF